jgi:hypothetical protein
MMAIKEAAHEGATPINNSSLSYQGGKVNLKAYREERGLKGGDIAETIRHAGGVKCDKAVVSKVENTDDYLVTFTPKGWRAIFKAHGKPPVTRSKPARHQVCVRFTESEFAAVLRSKTGTMQDYLHHIIMEALNERA